MNINGQHIIVGSILASHRINDPHVGTHAQEPKILSFEFSAVRHTHTQRHSHTHYKRYNGKWVVKFKYRIFNIHIKE